MLPLSEFTDERIAGIVQYGLDWLTEDFGIASTVDAVDWGGEWDDLPTLGRQVAEGLPLNVVIDGTHHTITRQTVIDGVQRQLSGQTLADKCPPEAVGIVDCWCECCLWGAPDVSASILLHGLGLHPGY